MRRDKEKLNEVSTARGRLEGALQVLIERNESDSSDESDVDVTDLIHEGRRKSASKTPLRKRRRLNIDKGVKYDQQTYVLKLFERSVNLAKFPPNTNLYPVCRAWMKNQPNNPSSASTSSKSDKLDDKVPDANKEEVQEEDKSCEVNSLPMPDKMPVDEDGELIDTRIPADLKPPKKQSKHLLVNAESAPPVHALFQGHLAHWWDVRRKWRQAAAVNETRYAASTRILKSILARP